MYKIAFLNSTQKQCGVYQWGVQIFNALKEHGKHSYEYIEISQASKFVEITKLDYDFIFINYHPITIPIKNQLVAFKETKDRKVKIFGTIHDTTQKKLHGGLFDIYLILDPDLENTDIVKGLPRCILDYNTDNSVDNFDIPVIGSFGFGFPEKGWLELITKVNEEFDDAIIKLNMAFNPTIDPGNRVTTRMAQECRSIKLKKGIELEITHDFMSTEDLLSWLSKNTINAFYYRECRIHGMSSVPDWALAVKKPMAVSNAYMFRHVNKLKPSICLNDTSFHEILNNFPQPLDQLWNKWSQKSFAFYFESLYDL